MLETNTALKESILQNRVAPKEESSDIATKNDVGQSSGHAISEQAPSPSFFQRIASFIGRFICPCFWFSKRDGGTSNLSESHIKKVENPRPSKSTIVSNATTTIDGEFTTNLQTVTLQVPVTGSVQCGNVGREKVIELLNQTMQTVWTENIEEQTKKDISRLKSYRLQNNEESPVELVDTDNPLDEIKKFCGDAFNDIVAIANQKIGVYGQNAIEHIKDNTNVAIGSSYAFPGGAGDDKTSEITVKKEEKPSNPRFIITFSDQNKGQTVYRKLLDQNKKPQLYNIQIPKAHELQAKTTVVIEVTKKVTNSLNNQVYEKKCLECYSSYAITDKDPGTA